MFNTTNTKVRAVPTDGFEPVPSPADWVAQGNQIIDTTTRQPIVGTPGNVQMAAAAPALYASCIDALRHLAYLGVGSPQAQLQFQELRAAILKANPGAVI